MDSHIFRLDKKHKHLLNDHYCGYIWVRNLSPKLKYLGKIVFTPDFATTLQQSVTKHAESRKAVHWLMANKTVGGIFYNTDFIKLLEVAEPSAEAYGKATDIQKRMAEDFRQSAKSDGVLKRLRAIYGPYYKVKRWGSGHNKRQSERRVWLWSFENKELNIKHEHIFSYTISNISVTQSKRTKREPGRRGQNGYRGKLISAGNRITSTSSQVGKSRRLFCDHYGLQYSRMSEVASGKRKQHRGWSLICEPRLMTHSEAITLREEMDSKEQ